MVNYLLIRAIYDMWLELGDEEEGVGVVGRGIAECVSGGRIGFCKAVSRGFCGRTNNFISQRTGTSMLHRVRRHFKYFAHHVGIHNTIRGTHIQSIRYSQCHQLLGFLIKCLTTRDYSITTT